MFLCLKLSVFSHFISQAHNFVALEHTVTLTLPELFRQDFPFPHPCKCDSKLVWFTGGRRLSLKNGILAKLLLSLSSDLKPRKIKTFDPLSVENLNCKDQEFNARLHIWTFAQCSVQWNARRLPLSSAWTVRAIQGWNPFQPHPLGMSSLWSPGVNNPGVSVLQLTHCVQFPDDTNLSQHCFTNFTSSSFNCRLKALVQSCSQGKNTEKWSHSLPKLLLFYTSQRSE